MIKVRKVLNGTVQAVKKLNVFKTPVCLRYELDPDYDTFAGGCITITLFTFFFIVFFNTWVQLLNKKNVDFKTATFKQQDPTQLNFKTDEFMFALGFSGLNVNDPNQRQFFDIKMVKVKKNNKKKTTTTIKLQACTLSHWQRFGNDLTSAYNRQRLSAFYCPPLDFVMNLKGKFTSQQFIYYKISVQRCTSSNCASTQQIQKFYLENLSFKFNFYYVNKLINPSQLKPVTLFLQDKDFQTFTDVLGVDTNLYIGEYQMSTDQSILPWKVEQKNNGIIVNRVQRQNWYYQIGQNDSYAKFYLRKSDTKFVIQRSYGKIDQTLAYIGGLFGLVAVFVTLIMDYYSQCSLELELCQQFFKYNNKKSTKYQQKNNQLINSATLIKNPNKKQNEKQSQESIIQPESFGILDFWLHLIYKVISKICDINWKRMKIYHQSVQQMRYILDIGQIIQKIAFFDRAISVLFTQNQLKLLYLQERFNLQEVRKQRKILSFNKQIIQSQKQMKPDELIKIIFDYNANEKSQKQSQKVRKRIDQFVIGRQFDLHLKQNKAEYEARVFSDQIKNALEQLEYKIQQNDQVSKRIYNGLQYNLLQAFQKSKGKKSIHFVTLPRHQILRKTHQNKQLNNHCSQYTSRPLIQQNKKDQTPQQQRKNSFKTVQLYQPQNKT